MITSKNSARRRDSLLAIERYVATIGDVALDLIAKELVAEMESSIDELREEHDLVADTIVATREGLRPFFTGLADDPWQPPGVVAPQLDVSRTIARRNLDVVVLLKLYRVGQGILWRQMMEFADRDVQNPEIRVGVLTLLWGRLSDYIETLLEHVVPVFQEERDRTMRGALAARVEMVDAILKNEHLDVSKASLVLGYQLDRWHIGLAAWFDERVPVAVGMALIESLVGQLASEAGSGRPFTMQSGSRGMWIWLGSNRRPDSQALIHGIQPRISQGLRIAAGEPGRGAAGFRESHVEALAAQQIAERARRPRRVTTYADVEVVSVLSRDHRAMRALVRRELAGLEDPDPTSERLRGTALTFLRCGLNASAAARSLGTHLNTVRYRIVQAEERLGHRIEADQVGLHLALMIVDTFGAEICGDL